MTVQINRQCDDCFAFLGAAGQKLVQKEALSSLSLGGVLTTLGYSAGRKTTIDVTDLIWKRARMAGFSLFAQSPTAIATAWRDILPLIVSGSIKPIVERIPSARRAKPCAAE